ncbi:hypothetical protein [Microbispora sp. NPDC049633]|uniref:hypothetical protein n=1 Tax=Microbispora sp. NPDC049633 TaxID=3154355 RepID=UPI00342DA322
MRIRTIHLDDTGDPERLEVEMTAAEAAFLVRVVGKLNSIECNRYGVSAVFDELDSFFNRFYDDGVKDFPTHAPSIVVTR